MEPSVLPQAVHRVDVMGARFRSAIYVRGRVHTRVRSTTNSSWRGNRMSDNPISPDGRWRWDGAQWVPNDVDAALFAAPPTEAPIAPVKKKMGLGKKIAIGAVAIVVIGVIGSLGDSTDPTAAPAPAASADPTSDPAIDDAEAALDELEGELAELEAELDQLGPDPEPTVEEPTSTRAQENALRAAQNYLDFSPFSKRGLIDQLTSEYGDGYELADARWAVNRLDVDWKEQAVRAAENYLELSSFSRQGLIEQLTSEYGDRYTRDQAVHAVNKVGL